MAAFAMGHLPTAGTPPPPRRASENGSLVLAVPCVDRREEQPEGAEQERLRPQRHAEGDDEQVDKRRQGKQSPEGHTTESRVDNTHRGGGGWEAEGWGGKAS